MSTLVFRVERHVFYLRFAAISIFCNNPDREGRTCNSCYWRGGMRNRAGAEVNAMCVTVAGVFKPFIKRWWHLTQISTGRYSPISRVMHYLYNGKGGLRYHPWHLLLPWFMAGVSHNTDYTSVQCCCGLYSRWLCVTGVAVLDWPDGVPFTHHLQAHDFWQHFGVNHFIAIPRTDFTVVRDSCDRRRRVRLAKIEMVVLKGLTKVRLLLYTCGFVHCRRAEALVDWLYKKDTQPHIRAHTDDRTGRIWLPLPQSVYLLSLESWALWDLGKHWAPNVAQLKCPDQWLWSIKELMISAGSERVGVQSLPFEGESHKIVLSR